MGLSADAQVEEGEMTLYNLPELTPNQYRLERWRLRMRAEGLYYCLRAHTAQRACGVDWEHRDRHGRLRMGPDGFLPRVGG